MSGNQRHNNASTVNLSDKYTIWCKATVVATFEDHAKAAQFLSKCPMGSYIQFPMGKCRDYLIAKQRKVETGAPVDKRAWDAMRRRQIARELEQAKELARESIKQADELLEKTPEEIAKEVFSA